jgi:glycosyltransferase involved in cell wall biosynthesis
MRVVLLANYRPDSQPSMRRFADLVERELVSRGVQVETWHPRVVVGGRGPVSGGLHKWLGYVDKLALFPPHLRRALRPSDRSSTIVHICDHSNAIYVPWIRELPHVVTCHDLLAVRAALDEFPAHPTRWSGRRLQQMIVRGLRQASHVVCDSESTRRDVQRIVGPGTREVIPPGLAEAFRPVPHDVAQATLVRLGVDPSKPYVLHVGGNQWYKNREGVVAIYAALVERMPAAPLLVLLGTPLSQQTIADIADKSLSRRIVSLFGVCDADLAALYSSAAAMLFPSLAEGFGWPVLEAMACGCRVVASDRAPITEVGGDAATYVDPERTTAAAAILERVLIESSAARNSHVAAGLARAAAFSSRATVDAYLSIYRDTLARARPAA